MPLVPGNSSNLRPSDAGLPEGISIIANDNPEGDIPEFDHAGRVIEIKHSDGSITISLDGSSLEPSKPKDTGWFANLAEDIPDDELARIADDLLRGVEDDLRSREEWIQERAQGIKLLGLKIEVPGLQGAADGAPVEGMSKVRHPLLQEAVIRFQANASAEMLPADGPLKIRNDNNNANLGEDQVANALQVDMNHYLTSVATEYYPDTDKMFLLLGFGGTTFKKVYFCPLRERPVSETVDADDLIINNAATDLRNSKRITHRSFMRPSVVKRLQILEVYRDIDLSTPIAPKLDTVQQEKNAQQGKANDTSSRPEDRDYEIYECYCELDIRGYEHKIRGKETGLEIPYRVTIDKSSKQVLSIVRNYDKPPKEDHDRLPEAKVHFAKYTYIPGFGFYDLGLLNLLGNTTNAITAGWRELLDAGMFACFPGFLISKMGTRQDTNIIRIPPGGGKAIETNGLPINQVAMPLPYKEPSPALMALIEEMSQTGQRVGGTAELQVGEGSQQAPVGTTLALIEQATKIANSVHKRMHRAQCEEFRLLFDCFREHPESFWKSNKKRAYKWDQETFLRALDDYDLVPQSDPNTSSMLHRLLKAQALQMMAMANPQIYDPIAVAKNSIQSIGYANPEQFMPPVSALGKPTPEMQMDQMKAQADVTKAQAAMVTAQGRSKLDDAKAAKEGLGGAGEGGVPGVEQMKAQADLLDAHTKAKLAKIKHGETLLNDANQQEDRQADMRLETMKLAQEVLIHDSDQRQQAAQHQSGLQADATQHQAQLGVDMQKHGDAMAHQHASLDADLSKHEQDSAIAEKAAKAKPKAKPKEKKS